MALRRPNRSTIGTITVSVALCLTSASCSADDSDNDASTEESPASTDTADDVPTFGIDADEYRDDPEALVDEFYSQENALNIAGATDATAESDENFDLGPEELAQQLGAPINQSFASELFVTDWESNPSLVEFLEGTWTTADEIRDVRLRTLSGPNTVGYEQGIVPQVVDVVSTDPLVTSIDWITSNNASESGADNGALLSDEFVNSPQTGNHTFTWVEEGGQLRISDVSYDN